MNTQDYIASGIIERYILGDVSTQEKKEVECMSHIYPEIEQELLQVQQTLEAVALQQSIEVPKHIKHNIFNIIKNEASSATIKPSAKIVELASTTATVKNPTNYKTFFVAACAIFILITTGITFILNQNSSKTETVLNEKIKSLEQDVAKTKQLLTEQSLLNTNTYILQGNAKAPNATVTVMWNKETGNVYVNNVTLPKVANDKQYQLWGLKDGKPIDLGVFDVHTAPQAMKQIKGMQAFAITLENKGGSPTPHLEQLHAILNI
jgi:hypothetical protein